MSTVLLVEDDRWMGDCYYLWLQGFGYKVVWVRDAQAAIDALDDADFDIIILDIMLPFANGIHLLNVIASHVDLMDIPVIICSSMAVDDLTGQYGVKKVLYKADLTPKKMQVAITGALANASI